MGDAAAPGAGDDLVGESGDGAAAWPWSGSDIFTGDIDALVGAVGGDVACVAGDAQLDVAGGGVEEQAGAEVGRDA